MSSRRLLLLVFIVGLVGGVIGYALTNYVVVLNLKTVDPVDWGSIKREVNLYIAPGQTLNINEYLGQIHQRSDRVRYCISVEGNLSSYKVMLRLFSLYATSQEAYAVATPAECICATIAKKSTDTNEIPIDLTLQGWIKARVNAKGVEQVKITITAEPQP